MWSFLISFLILEQHTYFFGLTLIFLELYNFYSFFSHSSVIELLDIFKFVVSGASALISSSSEAALR